MAKELAEIQYSETNKTPEFLKDLKPDTGYQPSAEESELLNKILKRFTQMKSARTRIDLDWQKWIAISESKFYPYSDGRTRVNVPVFRALQELFVSEAISRRIEKTIEPVGMSDIDKADIFKEVWEYDWKKNRRDEQMVDAEYKVSNIGTVMYLTAFEQLTRIITDIDMDDEGNDNSKKVAMKTGRIILKTLDIRNVYLDDRTTNFDDDNDQIYLEYLTPEQFEAEKGDKNLKNTEFVGTTSKTDQVYQTFEDNGRLNTGLIEKMHYWNKQSDKYVIIYNRSIIARDTPLPYAHKELPIVPRQFGYIPDSKYGKGLAEACMQFLDKINRLSEMLFDGLSRSNNSIFAMGNGLTFDGNTFSFNNQIIKFNGQLNDTNFREIKGIPPNQAAFQYLQDLLKEIAIYVGIDISQIIGTPSSTAFETAVRTESSLKRVNVVLTNRDNALQKVFSRHMQNIMQFFPYTSAMKILEVDKNGTITKGTREYPKLLLEGKKYIPDTGKLVDAPGKYEFEVSPEYIRGQFDITVKTNFSAPTLKSLKQENMKNFLMDYQVYSQISTADPKLTEILKPDDFVKQLAFTYDIDLDSIGGFADSITKEKDKLLDTVRKMAGVTEDMGALGAPSIPGQAPMGGENPDQSMIPNVQSKGLPNVKTPETPGINNMSAAEKIMI